MYKTNAPYISREAGSRSARQLLVYPQAKSKGLPASPERYAKTSEASQKNTA